jgi:hypothetical protein
LPDTRVFAAPAGAAPAAATSMAVAIARNAIEDFLILHHLPILES